MWGVAGGGGRKTGRAGQGQMPGRLRGAGSPDPGMAGARKDLVLKAPPLFPFQGQQPLMRSCLRFGGLGAFLGPTVHTPGSL